MRVFDELFRLSPELKALELRGFRPLECADLLKASRVSGIELRAVRLHFPSGFVHQFGAFCRDTEEAGSLHGVTELRLETQDVWDVTRFVRMAAGTLRFSQFGVCNSRRLCPGIDGLSELRVRLGGKEEESLLDGLLVWNLPRKLEVLEYVTIDGRLGAPDTLRPVKATSLSVRVRTGFAHFYRSFLEGALWRVNAAGREYGDRVEFLDVSGRTSRISLSLSLSLSTFSFIFSPQTYTAGKMSRP
jgi:hypothetical protein